jgi:diadenosine tetraphosphatase ApaH/serine/threonine PP2A family protein phosphatase
MRIALLADIHGNREALEAVLRALPAYRIDAVAILGDVVGYGPDPVFCLERVASLVEAGAMIVLGNHDAAIEGDASDMSRMAREAIEWTRRQLDPGHLALIRTWPEQHRLGDALFVHASARAPRAWEYITGPGEAERCLRATDAAVTLVGHVHQPCLWRLTGLGVAIAHQPIPGADIPLSRHFPWLGVVGSVGQPRDGQTAAGFAILDVKSRSLLFGRVPYDHYTTARKVREAGLPEPLAMRLLQGR